MLRLALSTTALVLLMPALASAQNAPSSASPSPAPTTPLADEPADDSTAPASVAAEPQGGIQDIVVTAQRRSERIQDVPIAISAFSAEQLNAQGVTSTLQLGNYVPNMVAQNNTGIGSANAYFLRGLGSTETIATFDPPVGTYVDDIYLSRQNANNLSMFDVQRIEVLRGPQGTLFGRNTTGGAINVIMAEPGKEFGGFFETGYGSYQKFLARGSLDIPFSDDFGGKISAYVQNDRGYVRNTTNGERLNDDDGWGARLGLRARISDSIGWTGSAMRIVSKGDNVLNFDCDPRNPANCDGRFASTGLSESYSAGRFVGFKGRKAGFGLGQKATSDILISKLNFGLGNGLDLAFISGFVGLSQKFAFDFADGRGFASLLTPEPAVAGLVRGGYVILNDGRHDQFSQEVKLTGKVGEAVDFVTGVYYLNEKNRTDLGDVFSGFFAGDRLIRNTTEAIAGYLQADLKITPQFTATAGIRYTDERKKVTISDNRAVLANDGGYSFCALPARNATTNAINFGNICLANANLVAVNGVRIPTRLKTQLWTPRFALNYKPSGNLLFFTSATRGFKSGGWNARQTNVQQFLPFDPEKVWSYELGMKSDWLDRRLRFNLTLFQLEVSDLQVLAGALAPNGTPTFITRNFADYRNRGAEIELSAQPMPGLNLYTNIGYQDDKYIVPATQPAVDRYGVQSVRAQQAACRAALASGIVPTRPGATTCGNGIVTATGEIATPVRTPDWTVSTGASYKAPLGSSGWHLTPSLNGSWRSKQEVAIANLSLYSADIASPSCGAAALCLANPSGNGQFISGSRSPGGWLVNASVTLSAPNDRYSLGLECANCLDREFIQSSLFNYSYLNMPRTWMLRGKVGF
jgi:iron complex outermembrane receptor protein